MTGPTPESLRQLVCAVCGAPRGDWDPITRVWRCTGRLSHAIFTMAPIPCPSCGRTAELVRTNPDVIACGACAKVDEVMIFTRYEKEYPTADRPVSKRNPSWTY